MSSSVAIAVENLGKCYTIRHQAEHGVRRYKSFRDVLANAATAPFRRLSSSLKSQVSGFSSESQVSGFSPQVSKESFWALRDVSFEIKQGEAVGIIGRNGAGKSTLLKLLSRITEPTTGEIGFNGRVASLLEVGTGFHPELTGRENIYLNGAIMGMSRLEIKSKFDEIVAFAEVERFLDTPVKRYSSGMYVRLAFAVAAHLEPEILIVDEVLAVGDAEFQKKCLGKMEEVSSAGRTVLFVSHNLAAIRSLCRKAIFLKMGQIEKSGEVNEVADLYAKKGVSQGMLPPTIHFQKQQSKSLSIWMESVTVFANSEPNSVLQMGDQLALEVSFHSLKPISRPIIGFVIRSDSGVNLINANNYYQPCKNYNSTVKTGRILCDLGQLPLMPGHYSASLWLCRDPSEPHYIEDAVQFQVEEKDIWGAGKLPPPGLSSMWWNTNFIFQ